MCSSAISAHCHQVTPPCTIAVAALKSSIAATSSADGFYGNTEHVQATATGWDRASEDLQQLVNDCARLLPPFDVKKAQVHVDSIGTEVAAIRARAAPRQRFTFSRKKPAAAPAAGAAAAGPSSLVEAAVPVSSAAPQCPPGAIAPAASAPSRAKPRWEQDEHTIEGLAGQLVLVRLGAFTRADASSAAAGGSGGPPEAECCSLSDTAAVAALVASLSAVGGAVGEAGSGSAASGVGAEPTPHLPALSLRGAKDLRLLNLTDCLVVLCDVTRAIRIDNLQRCAVVCVGPTAGSVLLHGCADCALFLQSRQIRLHTSVRCTFLLAVQSRPIIEFCSSLRFGPNPLWSPAQAATLSLANLPDIHAAPPIPTTTRADAAAGAGASDAADVTARGLLAGSSVHAQWQHVDDFGWHRVQRSPNWEPVQPGQWPADVASACVAAIGASAADGSLAAAARELSTALGVQLRYDSPGLTAIAAALREAEAEGQRQADSLRSRAAAVSTAAAAISSESAAQGDSAAAVLPVPAPTYVSESHATVAGGADGAVAGERPSPLPDMVAGAVDSAAIPPAAPQAASLPLPPPSAVAASAVSVVLDAAARPAAAAPSPVVAATAQPVPGTASCAKAAPFAAVTVQPSISRVVLPVRPSAALASADDDDEL